MLSLLPGPLFSIISTFLQKAVVLKQGDFYPPPTRRPLPMAGDLSGIMTGVVLLAARGIDWRCC